MDLYPSFVGILVTQAKRIQLLPAILLLENFKILTFSKIFSVTQADSLFVSEVRDEIFV